jgi:uncharacterized membrane protein required for colicin V production
MLLANIFGILIIFFSFVGGFFEGAVKNLFALIILVISAVVAGATYTYVAGILSFLSGENWEHFLGFFIVMILVSIILFFVLLIPRRLLQVVWSGGLLSRIVGAILGAFNAAIGLTVFALVLQTYPAIEWFAEVISEASVFSWLVTQLGFIKLLLPVVFRSATPAIV